ncbi:hypothetical protein SO802_006038 [Lithocarpus litseifolius]|uniref:PB1-like domain-containing protein n=1 Tax=Lithocarpus litseifolius TaxID=425828 RepID=A0AAW2DNZ9_9ROSI
MVVVQLSGPFVVLYVSCLPLNMDKPFDMSIHHGGVFITHSNAHVEYDRGIETRVSNVDLDTFAVFDMRNEFDKYERPSSPIDPSFDIVLSIHIDPSTYIVSSTHIDQSSLKPYEKNKSNWAHTYFSDEEHNIKSGESDYRHSDILCTLVNSEDDEEHPKYTKFRAKVDMPNPIFMKGMLFSDHQELKRDHEEYALLVKSYRGKHTCSRAFHSKMVFARWIAVAWLEVFIERPNITSVEINEGIKNQFQVDLSLDKAFRARQIALEMLKRRFAYQFERARDYCEELRSSNSNTTTKINLHTPTLHFKRIGFLKGQLLAAIGIDGNDRMYPIAYAVCEGENKDSWSLFLELLLVDIGPVKGGGWTFTSDQQRYAFSTWPKCDMLLNNLCESFNAKIVDARDKSILTMCEMIGRWDLTSILCKYTFSAISYKKAKAENYGHNFYKVETYLRTYSHLIQPTIGEDFWPNATSDRILPPKMPV